MKDLVGITERGDAALNEGWVDWVYKQNILAIFLHIFENLESSLAL